MQNHTQTYKNWTGPTPVICWCHPMQRAVRAAQQLHFQLLFSPQSICFIIRTENIQKHTQSTNSWSVFGWSANHCVYIYTLLYYFIFEDTILKNINGLNKCGCKYCVTLRQCLFHFRGLKYIPQPWPILNTLQLCCCWFVNIPFYRRRTCTKLNYLSMVYPATLPVAESTACIFFCKLGLLMWPQWATVARGNAPDGDTVSDVRFELWLLGGFFCFYIIF